MQDFLKQTKKNHYFTVAIRFLISAERGKKFLSLRY